MTNLIEVAFGTGKDLNMLQMCCRAVIVFLITLVMIRISGRRSFGVRTPLDNIIVILLGALLSRAIVGASPFWSVVGASFIILLIHRSLGWLISHSKVAGKLIEGNRICPFENNTFIKEHGQSAGVRGGSDAGRKKVGPYGEHDENKMCIYGTERGNKCNKKRERIIVLGLRYPLLEQMKLHYLHLEELSSITT